MTVTKQYLQKGYILNHSLCIDQIQFKGQIRDLNAQPHSICLIMVSSVHSVELWAVVNKVMNLQVPHENGDILTN
jgi:hypothetical protein